MADPRFPRGRQPIIRPNFPANFYKMKKIGPRGRGVLPGHVQNYLCRSATGKHQKHEIWREMVFVTFTENHQFSGLPRLQMINSYEMTYLFLFHNLLMPSLTDCMREKTDILLNFAQSCEKLNATRSILLCSAHVNRENSEVKHFTCRWRQ